MKSNQYLNTLLEKYLVFKQVPIYEKTFTNFASNSRATFRQGKTKLYFNNSYPDKEELCTTFDVSISKLPIKHLGLPLIRNKLKHANCFNSDWENKKQLKFWQWKFLSFSGSIELFKSVIYSYQYYWQAAFQPPMKTIIKIEQMMSDFCGKGECTGL